MQTALAEVAATDTEAGSARDLVSFSRPAYRLALRLLGSPEDAEDAVQQSFLAAVRAMPRGLPPEELRAWFLRVVANTARKGARERTRRNRREAAVMRDHEAVSAPVTDEGLTAEIRGALERLDEDRRLPIVLCCEEDLSHREAALVLGVPERTVARRVTEGLEQLRRALASAGYAAAPAALLGALARAAPQMPASLPAAIEGILAGRATGTGTGAASASVSAAAKGGLAMKIIVGVVAAAALAGGVAVLGSGFQVPSSASQATTRNPELGTLNSPPAMVAAGENPVAGPADREEVFEFAEKPTVTRDQGSGSGGQGKWIISFASKGKCDATVAIVQPDGPSTGSGRGKIVRHLASGVLGANAPWPFKQGSLSQKIEWDGKDDFGKPAPAGCVVRVGLGLKAGLGTVIEPSPYTFSANSVACDDRGNVYVADRPPPRMPTTMKVFDREGKYVRTILPPPGGLKPEEYTCYDVLGRAENPFFVPKANLAVQGFESLMGMAVSPKDEVIFSNNGYRVTKHLLSVRSDGANLRQGSQFGPWQCCTGPAFVALSKDEKAFYVGGVDRGGFGASGKGPYHCVFRIDPAASTPKEWAHSHNWAGKAPVFAGDPDKPGDDNAHFNMPRGVAADKDGNVYVCDFLNDRVQVLSPEGKHLRSIKVEQPDQVAVHRKTGEVYVLIPNKTKNRGTKKSFPKARVVKFSADGKEVCTFEFPGGYAINPGFLTALALDDSADPAIVWLANPETGGPHTGKGLWRVADRGKSFEKLGDVCQPGGWQPVTAPYNGFITVDPEEKFLYIKRAAKRCSEKHIQRIDLATGQPDKDWAVPVMAQPIDEVLVGRDGLLYARGCTLDRFDKGKKDEHVWRMDPATGKEVPFAAAPGGRITFPGDFAGNWQRRGFCVAPNGEVYVIVYAGGQQTLYSFGTDGKLKRDDLVTGIRPASCSVRVDRAGNIHSCIAVKPKGKGFPEILSGLKPDKELDRAFAGVAGSSETVGTLFKFGPEGGKIVEGGGEWLLHRAGVPSPGSVQGQKAAYVGIDPVADSTCTCPSNRHDLDGFDRVFAPHTHMGTVLVLDANYNRIARIGNYGNMDNDGPKSACPVPEIGLASPNYVAVGDRSLYIADGGNGRIVRADFSYHAEETVPVP